MSHNDPYFSDVRWRELVARTWFDPVLKRRVLDDSVAVLREEGIEIPEGVDVLVLEETPQRRVFVLPCPPDEISLRDVEGARSNLAGPISRIATGGAGTAHVIETQEDNES